MLGTVAASGWGLVVQLPTTLLGAYAHGTLCWAPLLHLRWFTASTGEWRRGASKFLLDKCVDQRNDVGKLCFGLLPADGLRKGNAQTVLLKQYYQCDHGPEDHRMLADLPPAKKQRMSKKQRGLSHKVTQRLRGPSQPKNVF